MDETTKLIIRAQSGDKEAMEILVRKNTKLIWYVAKKYKNSDYSLDDIFQIGSIGFMKAINNFDLDFGVKLSTYAVPKIRGEILGFLRDDGMIKVSRQLKTIAYKTNVKKTNLLEN